MRPRRRRFVSVHRCPTPMGYEAREATMTRRPIGFLAKLDARVPVPQGGDAGALVGFHCPSLEAYIEWDDDE